MNEVNEYVYSIIMVSLSLVLFLLPIAIYWRQKRRLAQLDLGGLEPIQGTPEELRQSEEALKGSKLELRQKMLRDFHSFGGFETFHGYSEEYMNRIVQELAKSGINATYLLHQSLPAGEASVKQHGGFELFVEKEGFERAKPILKKFLIGNP